MTAVDPRAYLACRFVRGGRDRATGLDCWGLYRLIVRDAAGIDLGDHGEVVTPARIARTLGAARHDATWRRISPDDERPLDLVLMTGLVRRDDGGLRCAPLHVGCVIEPGLMIDIEETTGVMVRPFRSTPRRAVLPTVAPRVLGVWRHIALEG